MTDRPGVAPPPAADRPADRLHLSPRHRAQLEALLREHLPGVEVWAYGSRITGESHDGSDLDLVLRAPDLQKIPIGRLSDLREALRESTIPFLVEARDWARLPEEFRGEIERDYVVLVEGKQANSARSEDNSQKRNPAIGAAVSPGWTELPFTDAVWVNPPVLLKHGAEYPFVDMAAIDVGSRQVCAIQHRKYSGGGSRFRAGDILMARITPCLENGKIARYCSRGASEMAHGSTEFIVIRGRPDVTDTEFSYYLTRWEEVRSYAVSQMTGTSGRQRVPTESLSHLSVPIPPLPEQRAIARVLGALDDKIELNRRMNETLEAMARALFQSWFVDFDPVRAKMEGRDTGLPKEVADLFPDRLVNSELGDVPAGWAIKTLGDLLELAYGKGLRADERNGGDVPVHGSNGTVGWHDRWLVQGPGIVVGRKGNPGTVTWVASDFFPIDTTFYVVPRYGGDALFFLFHTLKNQSLASVAADSAVPGLNRNLAYMNKAIVPSERIIAHFNQHMKPFFVRNHVLQSESRKLTDLRNRLLPELITGKLSATDVSIRRPVV